MRRILLLSGNVSAADRERCHALVDFLRRRARFDPEGAAPDAAPDRDALAEALLGLAGRGLLSYATAADGSVEAFYTPSREALQSVFEVGPAASEGGFPDAVQKKQAAAFRTSQGALLRFPLEQGEGSVEVFITDWSPCPAACAVAIHRAHPLAADLDKPEGSWFTGRYVRHPLTGDLLPVWVADWVRPDFGTGAVLVNPAHDATDLAFGRAIGLPIRFALVPASSDGSPSTWPEPPVVKTGQTIRTGPWDGRSVEEAAGLYFEVMAARGLAVRHRDIQAGRWKIGRLLPDPEGDLAWSAPRWTVLPPAAGGGSGARWADSGLLAAALSAAGSRPLLVCPAGEQVGELLALRLLVKDLTGQPLTPSALFLVQKVQESKVEASPELVRLAGLVGAPVQQVAVIKQQTVEQVQRFLRVHQELLAQAAEAGGTGAAGSGTEEHPAQRSFAKIRAAVDEGDPAKAFTLLQQTQKQLRDLPPEGRAGALPGYFDLAEVVAGLERPPGLEVPAWT